MTSRDNSLSPDDGEDLDELLEPVSELRSAAEQEGESGSAVKSGSLAGRCRGDLSWMSPCRRRRHFDRPQSSTLRAILMMKTVVVMEGVRMSELSSGARRGKSAEVATDVEPMLAVCRHDVHQLPMRSYESAAAEVAGVRVKERMPLDADGGSALLSRPTGEPEQTLDNHESPYRRSLLIGDVVGSRRIWRIGPGASGNVRILSPGPGRIG